MHSEPLFGDKINDMASHLSIVGSSLISKIQRFKSKYKSLKSYSRLRDY